MEPFVAAVLLRMARGDAFQEGPQAEPPDRELTEAVVRGLLPPASSTHQSQATSWSSVGQVAASGSTLGSHPDPACVRPLER
jgi:hypothetical protein